MDPIASKLSQPTATGSLPAGSISIVAIRVRVCDDDQRVGAINAGVTPATRQYVTEAGVRIGDNLEQTAAVYGGALQLMPETEGTIWFVDAEDSDNRVTFGFNAEGEMTWIALGALRENGWTCGR